MTAPLQDIRVLDLSRILAGPWCTMTLADLGAEVWKIEAPGTGDDTRGWMPPVHEGVSTYYLSANRNKKSIAIDMRTPQGREIVLDLARKADVLVENFRPGSLSRLGLDYDTLREVNPRLIYCSISGYGRDNEFAGRPGYDFVLQAETGFMSITGEPEGAPMKLGVAFVDLATGSSAVQAVLAALIARGRTGRGQHLDISLHHCGLQFLANVASGHLNTGKTPGRFGNAHPSIVPYQLFACADGYVALAVGNDGQFRALCTQVLEHPELAEDTRFLTNELRVTNREALIALLDAALAPLMLSDLIAALEAAGVPGGRVYDVAEAFASPEAQARGVTTDLSHPSLGQVRTVASPLRMSDTPVVAHSAPPELGQHSHEVLREVLGWGDAKIKAAEQSGAIARRTETEHQAPL